MRKLVKENGEWVLKETVIFSDSNINIKKLYKHMKNLGLKFKETKYYWEVLPLLFKFFGINDEIDNYSTDLFRLNNTHRRQLPSELITILNDSGIFIK